MERAKEQLQQGVGAGVVLAGRFQIITDAAGDIMRLIEDEGLL